MSAAVSLPRARRYEGPVIDGAALRARLVAAGVLRPGVWWPAQSAPTFIPWIERPTLMLDPCSKRSSSN